eukprot:2251251-Ditylum_brightwellii.AAC.1
MKNAELHYHITDGQYVQHVGHEDIDNPVLTSYQLDIIHMAHRNTAFIDGDMQACYCHAAFTVSALVQFQARLPMCTMKLSPQALQQWNITWLLNMVFHLLVYPPQRNALYMDQEWALLTLPQIRHLLPIHTKKHTPNTVL